MTLQSVLVYVIQNSEIEVVLQRHYIVLHMDNQNLLTENVVKKIALESFCNGELVSHHGIVNMFTDGVPQALIYQNVANFGVVFVFTSSDEFDNRIAASLTLNAITTRMAMLVKNLTLEKVIAQPEDVYAILDNHIPNGKVIIVNDQISRNL